MQTLSSPARILMALLSLVVAVGCNDMPMEIPTSVSVKVNIVGIPSGTQALKVSVDLNDKPHEKSPYTYPNSNSVIWVELPADTRARLSVSIDTLEGGCKTATGKSDTTLTGNGFYEMTVNLSLLPSKMCTLTVVKNGGGRVVASPAGVDCGQTCSFDYAFGTSVSLTGIPDVGMNPPVWSNACSGAGPCMVTLTAPATVAIDFAPKICSKDGWCWENPTPQGNDLTATWIAPDNTVYAVGAHGTILKWNGIVWVAMDGGTTKDLSGIWGSGNNDIWVVGKAGTMLHWNGVAWFSQNPGVLVNLNSIWGSKANDIWAVGATGTAIHYDGVQWTPADSKTTDSLVTVWGTAGNDVWAGGGISTTHFDGTAWTATSTNGKPVAAIWGSGAADVWAVGQNSILHWQGSAWSPEPPPATGDFRGVWGSSGTNVWIANGSGPLLRWRGSRWTLSGQPETAGFTAVSGIQDTTVWAVGGKGRSINGDGTTWNVIGQLGTGLKSGWAASPSDAWALGSSSGDDNIYHWNGASWQVSYTLHGLQAIWGSAPDDVWAVGGDILHWDGSAWTVVKSGFTFLLSSVFGSGPKDVWVVGGNGQNLHWDGAAWTVLTQASDQGRRVEFVGGYADGRGVWAIGDLAIYKWGGSAWQRVMGSNGNYLSGIAGYNNAEIFVLGGATNGLILRWDGTAWKDETPAGAPWMNKAYVGQAGDAWAVGNAGAMYHWNGTAWSAAESGTGTFLNSVFGSSSKDLFAFGINNVVLRYRK